VKRIFFVAGESSGDTHGSNLIRAILEQNTSVQCEGIGGRQMEAAGMTLHFDLASNAIMGFFEVIKSFSFIRNVFYETLGRIQDTKPDVVVLIDYPGFNIRLAKEIKKLGIPIVFYISPQIWAWKKGRIHTLAELVDKMLVILPFEKPLYDEVGLDCTFVGHPLIDHIEQTEVNDTFSSDCTIGLLPGSREQEIKRIFPVMLEVAENIRTEHPDAKFVVPCVDDARSEQIKQLAGKFPLEIVQEQFYDILTGARFCLVASGTATLETALFNVPMIVMYKVTGLTYWLAKLLVSIDAVALVNILAKRHIVPEYIQGDATVIAITPEALELIGDTYQREKMLHDLAELRSLLGAAGASKKAAQEILTTMEKTSNG
jgi:lipid-A-disaccharide synthase